MVLEGYTGVYENEVKTKWKRSGNEVWYKTNKSIPDANGIKVDRKILESYVGLYEVTPDFTFLIIKKEDKLLLQVPVQELLQMFADTKTKFFLKVYDAQFEFVKVDEDNYATNIYSSSRKFLGQ